MLDIRFIRQHPEAVQAGARKKRIECDVGAILSLDGELRARGAEIDALRAEQNALGRQVARAQVPEKEGILARLSELKLQLGELEGLQKEQSARLDGLLLRVPNVPAEDVPEGKDDSENVVVSTWGEPRRFDFEPRDHVALAEAQGWLDIERAARLAGSRNYVLIGDLSLLEGAVMRCALDSMVAKGFVPLSVPTLVRTEVMYGTGYFPGGEDQAYRCDERDDLCLVGTAEVPVTALYQDEILDAARLPLRFVAQSSCYRREAGTYGKDTRGLYRVHQFQKVEQVVIDVADAERSLEHHRAIVRNAEELLRALELPYRIVNVCGGDLGAPQVQKFDIETWMPSRQAYGETHSASRFHDFQARRLGLRYRERAEEGGKVRFCHTLNNTVAASARMLIALLENHQRADGTVYVPEPLRAYMGGRGSIGREL
ncbi:MAG TPA: serine--tRNA ligase [Planctomycetota bacterium]|nr:serine--tRNA ligase [Planctomycetota bacterium]